MDNFEVLQKAITETKYLSQENTYRYRPIMRFFYHKYEEAENWLFKEDIYDELKDKIDNYTMEDLERDLEFLVDNLSLTTVQDVNNINSLADFKYKKYRYQLTDYAIAIERMTIELEEMEVKVASLSPKRFEVLRDLLRKLKSIDSLSNEELLDTWERITNEFSDINRNYQDFLKKFQESKTEELLQSTVFLEYKNKMIQYLKDFITGYLNQAEDIREILKSMDNNFQDNLIKRLEEAEKGIPKIALDFNYQKFNQVNLGKWRSIYKWFVNTKEKSEGDRLLEVTSNLISRITKCASSLIELHGNMIKRKEEYKYICKLFDKKTNLTEVRDLSNAVFGIYRVKHFKGISKKDTDSLVNSYEVKPTIISVLPNDKKVRAEKRHSTIVDKTSKKKEILELYEKEEARKKEMLKKFVQTKVVELKDEVRLTKEERGYLLNLISKAGNSTNYFKEPLFGLNYKVNFNDSNTTCRIISDDGIFTLPSLSIIFEGGYDGIN